MLWSILIAAIPERYHSTHGLLLSLLEYQSVARIPDIELLYLMDNKRRSVGEKRNDLLAAARGEYISFIDDDDEVAPDYVQRIHRTIAAGRKQTPPVDVICFRQIAHLHPHGVTHDCTYSLAHFNREQRRQLAPALGADGKPEGNRLLWTGPPAHTMVWRRTLVADIKFPSEQFGEDVTWVDAACARAKSETQIDFVGYHYKFDPDRSATR